MGRDRHGFFEGQPDPDCSRYYAGMAQYMGQLNDEFRPLGGRIAYVGEIAGSLTAIWKYGKRDRLSGFASGRDYRDLRENVFAQAFEGL